MEYHDIDYQEKGEQLGHAFRNTILAVLLGISVVAAIIFGLVHLVIGLLPGIVEM